MTEDDAGDVPGAGPATRAPQGATAGGMIRAAREAQGIDLGSLAAMLKIPMKKLEALEADRHDELPGASFERALAQAACRALQIDPRPVLALLPAKATSLDRVAGSLNEPFRERLPSRGGDLGESSTFLRPAFLLPALLVLAAAALLLLPPSLWHRVGRQVGLVTDEAASAPAAEASGPGAGGVPVLVGGGAASAPAVVVVPAQPAASEPLFPPSGEASGAAAVPVAPPVMSSAALAPSPGASAAAPVALASSPGVAPVAAASSPVVNANAPIVVTAHQATWVEAVDAQGRTLVSRTVAAGDALPLDGALPIKLKIGNAQGTTVTLRGQNVDLAPWVRDNVARLQLK